MATLKAAAAGLRLNLESLATAAEGGPDPAALSSEVLLLLRDIIADPRWGAPPLGLAFQESARSVARRLETSAGEAAERAAAIVVRAGFESMLPRIEALLDRWGAERLLPLLDAAGRVRAGLRALESSVTRLAGLEETLREALEASREAGAAARSSGAADLRSCLAEALSELEVPAPEALALEFSCPEGLRVPGGPGGIQQVVVNLVRNALDAVPSRGGRVLVEAARSGSEAVVRVEDNGEGIPEEIRHRIFSPFVTTRAPGRGMGLGLFVSRRIVEARGGTLTFTSRPGSTCFEVRLPLEPVVPGGA